MHHPFEELPFLLVSGQARSGTTVLTKAIAEHPHVYSNRVESNVIKQIMIAGRGTTCDPSQSAQMMVSLDAHNLLYRRFVLHLQFPINGQLDIARPKAVSTFSAMNPSAAEFAVEVFPKICFANIIRNGIEVVSSRSRHRVLKKNSFDTHCRAWTAGREMVEWGNDQSIFVLFRHENLLDQSKCANNFEKLFETAGVEPNPAAAEYVRTTQHNQTSFEQEPASNQSDLSTRGARWQYWTAEQRKIFAEICGETMQFYGYAIPWM